MSTKTSLYWNGELVQDNKHALRIHAYKEMHESSEVIVFNLECTTSNCAYQFVIAEHLGLQLIEKLENSDRVEKEEKVIKEEEKNGK